MSAIKSFLYCYYDLKSKAMSEPFCCPNDDVAKRNFLFGCFGAMLPPHDCVLFKIAEFERFDESQECKILPLNSSVVVSPTDEEIMRYEEYYRVHVLHEEM